MPRLPRCTIKYSPLFSAARAHDFEEPNDAATNGPGEQRPAADAPLRDTTVRSRRRMSALRAINALPFTPSRHQLRVDSFERDTLGSMRRFIVGVCCACAFLLVSHLLASGQAATLLSNSLGRWVVGNAANCGAAPALYTLSVANDNVVWKDGLGNVDIERIDVNTPMEFQTTTISSNHRSGPAEKLGTKWTYTSPRAGLIKVQPSNRQAFLLTRCP